IQTTADATLITNQTFTCSTVVDLSEIFPLEPNHTYTVQATYFSNASDGIGDYIIGTIKTATQTISVNSSLPSFTGVLNVTPEALGIAVNPPPIPSILTAILCNLTAPHVVTEVDTTSVTLDGTLAPLTSALLTTSPGCTGKALKFTFDMAGVIASIRAAAGHPLAIGTQETLTLGGRLESGATFTASFLANDTVLIDKSAVDLIVELIALIRGMALPPTVES